MSFSSFIFVGLVALAVLLGTLHRRQRADSEHLMKQVRLLDLALTKFRDRLEVLEGKQPSDAAPAPHVAIPVEDRATQPTNTPQALSFFTEQEQSRSLGTFRPDASADDVPVEDSDPAPEPIEPIDEEDVPSEEEPVRPAALATPPRQTATSAKEEAFTSRWLIWIGGVTMALGGAFIVKFSIDQGWFGPTMRIFIGLLLGAALLGVGEYLRRASDKVLFQRRTPDYLPGTLTGVGILTLYASIWAAFGLYDLITPFTAFSALALIAFGSLALGLLHGPAIAGLGILGAMLVPAIVSTGSRSTNLLFSYLVIVTSGGLAVMRYRQWWGLGGLTLGAGILWATIWLMTGTPGENVTAPGLFTIVISVIALWANRSDHDMENWRWDNKPLPFAVASLTMLASGVVIFALFQFDQAGLNGLLVVLAFAAVLLASSWVRHEWITFSLLSGALLLLALATWPPMSLYADLESLALFSASTSFGRFTILAAAGATLTGLVGFGAAFRKPAPGYWASLSTAVPLIILVVSYARWSSHGTEAGWAGIAMGLAFVFTLAAERHKHRNAALGAYAAAAFAGLSLSTALYLQDAWLTLALSLQLPAMAFLCVRLNLPVLRRIALAIAVVVIARLAFNPFIFDYDLGAMPILNWILWGYGIPTLAFWWSSIKFRETADDVLVKILEAGAIAFATIFVTLEIRTLFQDSLSAPYSSFAEASVRTLAWMGISYGLYRRNLTDQRPVLSQASLLLRYGGLAHMALYTLLFKNPVLVPVELGDWPVMNLTLLAYLGPAIITTLYARAAHQRDDPRQFSIMAGVSIALMHVWLFMEIRQLFHGSLINVPYNQLLEVSIQTLGFLGLNYGLTRFADKIFGDPLEKLLTTTRWIGLLQMFLFHFVVVNPLFIHTDVGATPLFNVLLLAFAAPGAITGYMAWQAMAKSDQRQVTILGSATLVLLFSYISLSVRQIYTGGYLDAAPVSDPEQYTYSVVWILLGIGLLALGIKQQIRALRYASLGVLMLATAKVFIWDMSGLTGLLRAVSFLGLGGTLLAIGFVYQRYVFPAAPVEDTTGEVSN
jgi:uncharacterized membrane protein